MDGSKGSSVRDQSQVVKRLVRGYKREIYMVWFGVTKLAQFADELST